MFWFSKRKVGKREYLVKNIRFGTFKNDDVYCETSNNAPLRARSRHDRICHSCWRVSGYCNHRNNALPTKTSRTLECNCRRNKRPLATDVSRTGQSTVEFVIVTAGLICVVVALGALWHSVNSGLLVEHALSAASHHLVDVPAAFIVDIFRF